MPHGNPLTLLGGKTKPFQALISRVAAGSGQQMFAPMKNVRTGQPVITRKLPEIPGKWDASENR